MKLGKTMIVSSVVLSALSAMSAAATISIPLSDGFTAMPPNTGTNVFYYSGYYYSTAPTECFIKYDLTSIAPAPGQQLVINSVNINVAWSAPLFGDPFTQSLYGVSNDTWSGTGGTWLNMPAASATAVASDVTLASWTPGNIFNSTAAFANLVKQEAEGDGVLSLMFMASEDLGDPGTPGGEQRCAEYYINPNDDPSPRLVIDYSYVPVPEPASAGLLGAGLLLLGARRRRGSSC